MSFNDIILSLLAGALRGDNPTSAQAANNHTGIGTNRYWLGLHSILVFDICNLDMKKKQGTFTSLMPTVSYQMEHQYSRLKNDCD